LKNLTGQTVAVTWEDVMSFIDDTDVKDIKSEEPYLVESHGKVVLEDTDYLYIASDLAVNHTGDKPLKHALRLPRAYIRKITLMEERNEIWITET